MDLVIPLKNKNNGSHSFTAYPKKLNIFINFPS